MKKWVVTSSRDIFCLLLLIGLGRYAVQRVYQDRQQQYRARISKEPFVSHELSQAFIDQLSAAKKQVKLAAKKIKKANPELTKRITTIAQNIEAIYQKYTKNSPALAMLGPIGTTAVVLKEQELEKQLRKKLNQLGAILTNPKDPKQRPQKPESVSQLLLANQKLLG